MLSACQVRKPHKHKNTHPHQFFRRMPKLEQSLVGPNCMTCPLRRQARSRRVIVGLKSHDIVRRAMNEQFPFCWLGESHCPLPSVMNDTIIHRNCTYIEREREREREKKKRTACEAESHHLGVAQTLRSGFAGDFVCARSVRVFGMQGLPEGHEDPFRDAADARSALGRFLAPAKNKLGDTLKGRCATCVT